METRPLRDTLNKSFSLPLANKATQVIRSLSPGDKVIFTILAVLMSIGALFALTDLKDQIVEEVPAHGGTLTEGVVGSPRFVNPLLALSDTDRDLVELTFAGLMGVDEKGNLVPELAESYEISEDGKIYTFTLKEGVIFHDGEPVTAEDIAFTVSKVQDPLIKSPKIANWLGVQTEVEDDRTISFILSDPYAPFLENATLGILPKHIWADVPSEEFPFSQFVVEPIGAGPYKVTNVKRDSSGILKEYNLRSFSDYALGKPYINAITIKFYGNESALQKALTRGEVESAHSLIPENIGDSFQVVKGAYLRVFGVFLNQNENEVLADKEVRQALFTSVDRQMIIDEVLSGYGTALTSPLPGVADDLPEDPTAEAIQILENDGWEFSVENRVWEKGNDVIRITLRTSNVPELAQTAQIIKQNFEAIGVPTSLELYDTGELSQGVIRPRNYQGLLFGMVLGRVPDLYAFWHSSQRNDPGLNVALYANVDADDALERLRETQNAEDREEYLEQFLTEVAADIPAIFTHAPELTYFMPKDVKGVSLPPLTTASDRFSSVHTWYRETEKVWPFLVQQ
ncbi:MAG: ABC transporter substrate-binding protein [Patescibacteria group bacterium UBA2103]